MAKEYLGLASVKAEGNGTSFDPGGPAVPKLTAEHVAAHAASVANTKLKMDTALAAVEAMSGWMPIESAPTDGTWVMLAGAPVDLDAYDQEPPMAIGFWDGEAWAYSHWDGGWRSAYAATKWKPLA